MRKILCLAACLLLMSAATVQAAGVNIAVFDLQKVAADSDALKEARTILDSKFGPQKIELEKEREGMEKTAMDLEKEREALFKMAENQRDAKKVKALEQKVQNFSKQQRDYSEKAQAFMRLLQADELRVRTELDSVISRAAKNLAKRKSYTLILDISLVPYVDPALDVTNDILTETNAVWKAMDKQARETGQPASADTVEVKPE